MYIGRFAPTPSGGLHFGSLVAALASFLDAKKQGGKWLLRIEDLDFPRNQKDADSLILKQLQEFELFWDDEVIYQSKRLKIYKEILTHLADKKLIYACDCTRKDLANRIYASNCCDKNLPLENKYAWRLKLDLDKNISWQDRVLGKSEWRLSELGEPILKRKDGIIAYQLAVVVDDYLSGVNQVVRGEDLLSSTAWQICLYEKLKWRLPTFAHIPLVFGDNGKKLSKQNLAPVILAEEKLHQTRMALKFLGIDLPQDFLNKSNKVCATQAEVLEYAIQHWNLETLKRHSLFPEKNKKIGESKKSEWRL